jgi:hypothetical protein
MDWTRKLFIHEHLRQFARRIFPEMKEIVLVRDPRDYFCSAKRFWKLETIDVINRMKTELPRVRDIADDGGSALFVRYEDLVTAPEEGWRTIERFLGAEHEQRDISKEKKWLTRHATSTTPSASVGRWKTDMVAEEVAACEANFGWMMNRFGYGGG